MAPLGYDKVRKDTGEHVEPEDIVRVFDAAGEMAKSLVENLSAEFDPERYDDTYRSELLD